MPRTIQELVDLAVEKTGGQAELAREITRRYRVETSQQAIEYLQQRTRKPAQRSSLTPYIAEIAGVGAAWAPAPKKIRDGSKAAVVKKRKPERLTVARTVSVRIKETGEIKKVELTKEALRVAQAFMDLDRKDRQEILRSIEVMQKLHVPHVPNQDVARAYEKPKKRTPSKFSQ